jgi:imidazolonepropionase-like amidohydrolase
MIRTGLSFSRSPRVPRGPGARRARLDPSRIVTGPERRDPPRGHARRGDQRHHHHRDPGTIEKGTIIIRNGKIAAIGKDLAIPAGAQVIDGTGKYVMPGIIDAHSHSSG